MCPFRQFISPRLRCDQKSMHRFVVVFTLLLWIGSPALADAKQPHMVIFLSDDHTCRDSSVYGSKEIDTPNMQRLASAGMTFDQAFVNSPSCAPSRAALMTGLFPTNNGSEANHSKPESSIKKLPAYLQDLGYEVVSFGKVGHYGQTPMYGFDVARHFNYHEDVAIDRAIDWLQDRKSEKPLCLFVGTNWPHVPWPDDTEGVDADKLVIPVKHADTKVTRIWRAKYVAAVKRMDEDLGKVYEAAKSKLGDDLFFLHTSDHGAQWPFEKWNLYERGARTPMIVSWPGKIAADSRSDAVVSWMDILPTLVDVAGGEAPKELDGKSFLPVLKGNADKHHDAMFTAHSGDGNYNVYPSRSVRTADRWRYIRNLHPEFRFNSHATLNRSDGGYWDAWVNAAITDERAREIIRSYQQRPSEELYNLNDDPDELHNLASDPAHAKKLKEISAMLDKHLVATNDTLTVFGQPQRVAKPGSPNIITVLIDDMGHADLSCFGGKTKTEHIDRLASEGIRFTNFYVNSPICSPSRVALTTGQYPQRWRISSFLNDRKNNNERGMNQWLDPQAPTLARQLLRAGYFTGHFGKWHMGGQRDVGEAPLIDEYGFDRSLTNFEGLGPRVLGLNDDYSGKKPTLHHLGSNDLGTGPIETMPRSEITGRYVERAIEHIDQAIAKDQPFFINVWPDDVHSPFFPPKDLRDKTDESKRALYHAVLDAMDQQLAPLFDRIRSDASLRENTLIVLCSDNGFEPGAGNARDLSGSKGFLYEGGIRSPLVVWGPGFIAKNAAGTTNETSFFSSIDLNRSLYSITDTELPEGVTLDGENVIDTLLGKSAEGRQSPLFFRRPPDRPTMDKKQAASDTLSKDAPDLAVRDGKWKFLIDYDQTDPQLFDLSVDPSEKDNLIEKHSDVAARLQKAILDWNATLPKDAGDPSYGKAETLADDQFVNPIGEGADPWVMRHPDGPGYLWCMSEGNTAIAIHTSDTPTSLGQKHIVWRAPAEGPVSKEVWAPEMHYLDGRYHVYFAASDGRNENHLAYVLVSESKDPLGEYELHGPMKTGEGIDRSSPNIWAIDMTVLEHVGQRYAIWSGWDQPGSDRQYLYIAKMKSPMELEGPRVRICSNDDFPWEFTENAGKGRGLNEGPQILKHAERTFMTYSCGGSWLPTYKLGMLELTGSDPLDPMCWVKYPRPVFNGTTDTYGVGHSCFVPSVDGKMMWHIYHAKRDREPGWRRGIHVQPMTFNANDIPEFGRPLAPGLPQKRDVPATQADLSGQSNLLGDPAHWQYFGHHQRYEFASGGLRLGIKPSAPINDFDSGEKVVLKHVPSTDVEVSVKIQSHDPGPHGTAGILFRVSGSALGYDALRGYFAGVNSAGNYVELGKMDGTNFKLIQRVDLSKPLHSPIGLKVKANGPSIKVQASGTTVIEVEDSDYSVGVVGLRVVRTDTTFTDFSLENR
jgi:arylsulfatase A-like enzyme/GH43 family beta-xylosidase